MYEYIIYIIRNLAPYRMEHRKCKEKKDGVVWSVVCTCVCVYVCVYMCVCAVSTCVLPAPSPPSYERRLLWAQSSVV